MKNVLILSLCLLMFSCGKDDDSSGNNTNAGTSFISMKVNGVEWKADVNFYSSVIGGILIAGSKKDNNEKTQAIAITFPDFNTNGTNEFTNAGKAALIYGDAVAAYGWAIGNNSSGTGKITVTKSKIANGSLQVSASFSLTTKDANGKAIVVTDGIISNVLAN